MPKCTQRWERDELPGVLSNISSSDPSIVYDAKEEKFLDFMFNCTKLFRADRLEALHELAHYFQNQEQCLFNREPLLKLRNQLLKADHLKPKKNKKKVEKKETRWFLCEGLYLGQCLDDLVASPWATRSYPMSTSVHEGVRGK